ncbi:MAG: ArnT family glycosyltransferase [Spirosomataceae bacterium]
MNFSNINQKYYPLIIAVVGAVFFIPNLGNVHLFDWDEINFAESAREMILTGDYWRVQIDFKPFWEKPPFFFWMQVLSMKTFGINEFAARFPNAIMGVITLVTLYVIGKKEKDTQFGLLWALSYLGSLTPHLYFKSGIIDPTFNYFIFLGIYFSYIGLIPRTEYGKKPETKSQKQEARNQNQETRNKKQEARYAFLAGLFIGLAVLTKGPVGGLIWGLVVVLFWAIYGRFRAIYSAIQIVIFFITCFAVASIWFMNELITNGLWFFKEFLEYQVRLFSTSEAGHGQPFYYHFLVVLIGCFPISILGFPKLFRILKPSENTTTWTRFAYLTFWVVMILFSLTTTKIVHYSSMTYFSLSFFAATFIQSWLNGSSNWSLWHVIGTLFIGFLLSFILSAVPYVGMNSEQIIPLIKDKFAAANFKAKVDWSGWEMLIGICYFVVILWVILSIKKADSVNKKIRIITPLFSATAITLFLYGAFVVPKIERYTQGAAIDFYESKQGQNVAVEVLGFKSYAHLFYFKKPASQIAVTDTFYVTKIDRYDDYQSDSTLKFVEEKNGFVFLKKQN